MIRPDLIFSYWIYLWYILYIFKVLKYNPKLAIIFGMIKNTKNKTRINYYLTINNKNLY